jgi:hypothetical protein
MTSMDFGAPVPVTESEVPKGSSRGRKSALPALQTWIAQLTPGQSFELASPDGEGHPVSRVSQIRKVGGETVTIRTYPVQPGKRYRIFAHITGTLPEEQKAAAAASRVARAS